MFCPNCGNNLEEGTKFCDECGTMIEEAESKSAPEYTSASVKKEKKSKTGLIVATVAVIVALALVVVFVILPMLNDDKDGKNSSDGEQSHAQTSEEQVASENKATEQTLPADEDENPAASTEVVTNSNGSWIEYEYDADGNKLRSTFYNSDGSKYSLYKYDADGNVSAKIYYYSDGEWAESECDANGYTTKTVYYDVYGDVKFWIEFELDADGKVLEEIWYNADGTLME